MFLITVNLEAVYNISPKEFAKRFDQLLEAFAKDKQTSAIVMQGLLLKKIAETQPGVYDFEWMVMCCIFQIKSNSL